MPRGKYVNHKGRSRHFTSPEELEQQSSDQETSSGEEDAEGDEGGAAGTSSSATKLKQKPKTQQLKKKTQLSSSEQSEEDDSDEDEEDDRDAKKGVASLIEIENPNRVVKKATQKVSTLTLETAAKPELTRREREQIEKQKARQRYEKLHAAGKTSEAKADLARLALIRQQRAEAQAKREAEKKAADDKKSSGKA